MRVQDNLLFIGGGQGLDPRQGAALTRDGRGRAGQARRVATDQVEEDGLSDVVRVVAWRGREGVRAKNGDGGG